MTEHAVGQAVEAVVAEELAGWLATPSVIYPLNVADFLATPRRLCTMAAVPLSELEQMAALFTAEGRVALLNVDTCPGLGRDDAALGYVRRLGFPGVLSTRLATLQKARALGLLAVQVLFFTDGATVAKGIAAVRSAKPHLVQVMPAPVLGHLSDTERSQLGTFVASGFVRTADDVAAVLDRGGVGATTTTQDLWTVPRG